MQPGDYDKAQEAYRSFGAYLKSQRQLAQLTLRQLAELSKISNPYLSQIERGLHQPSVAVIRSIADALNLSADALLAQVAGIEEEAADSQVTTESAIRADNRLTSVQKAALLSVYRSMVGQTEEDEPGGGEPAGAGADLSGSPDSAGVTAEPAPVPVPSSGPSRRASSRRSGSTEATPAKRAANRRRPATGSEPEPGAFGPAPDRDAGDP